jgi:class 3 adenylate cyclase/tetratricopeptide (TPR) repeat protein
MQVCPACGEENPERARFCLACGADLSAPAAGEERKVVSVLFVDLVGFTGRSDRADPEDVRALLRPYHERVKADIERFGGTVEKFIGDAVMAVFGAPVAHEDDAERALRAALRILETIEELRGEGLDVAVRAAVTTGEAVVALGARPERGEGIVTGDVVNTAARLQAASPVGGILVDESTMHSAERAIAFEPQAPVDAKGKAEPVSVWRATHARARVGEPEAAARTPLVGREHERALLFDIFLRAERESSVQLLTVVGEPGIGKSRLVTELRTLLDDRPEIVTWRHGRCLPYGEGITFWALAEIVKAEAGILESDDPQEAKTKLEETLASLVDDKAERAWFSTLLAPLAGAAGEGTAVSREEAFTAWRRFLEALAARRPCVLVVEDLHWADDALLEFLEHLLDWSMPVPLLLLATARPELFERQPSWGGGKRNATTISLAPLSNEESARLLQLLLERTLLPAETQAVLLERAGGNPLYAEQFARMLSERADIEDVTVPETVQALVAARLDTLRPELKGLLQDAAVVGRVFWSGAVAALGTRARGDVRRDLNELVRREFVRPIRVSSLEGEDEFSFWHALVRDVAYQQIPRSPRADKHVAAATWIAETAGERLADQAEILVHHYEQALELSRAAGQKRAELEAALGGFLLLAGERSAQLDAERAESYLRRALTLAGDDERVRARVLAELAPVLVWRGAIREGIDAYEYAIPVLRVEEPRTAAVAIRFLAQALWARGQVEEARALGEDGISLLEGDPGPELVSLYGSAANRAALEGRSDEAVALAEQGLALADELGVQDVVHLFQARASVLQYAGDPRAIDDSLRAREVALRVGLGRGTAIAIANHADALFHFESASSARASWDEAIEFSRARGLTEPELWCRGERLRALYHLGDWRDLEQEAGEVLRWVELHGGGQIDVFARVELAQLHVHRDEVVLAAEHVAALLPRAREIGVPQLVVPGLAVAALVSWVSGDEATALASVAELEATTRGTPMWRSLCLAWPARIAVASGRLELAQAFLDGADQPAAWDRSARAAVRAALAEVRGSLAEAEELYREAAERWDAYGSVVEHAYALLGLGRCGDAKALRDGEAIFGWLGAQPVATALAA